MSDDIDNAGLWQHLKTVTLFDKNKTRVVNVPKKNIGLFSPASLLIESLIKYICTLVENETNQRKQLYLTICQKLYELQLIDDTYLISDFDFIRNHYQKELHRLVTVAKSVSSVFQESSYDTVPVPPVPVEKRRKRNGNSKLFDWSRFSTDYTELDFIARGGFGEVFKVQNKLDAGIYAMKKICLKYCSIDSFIRGLTEVQMLAKLNHPNIVSYKAAWLEPLANVHKKAKQSKDVARNIEFTYSKKDDSCEVVFVESDGSRTSEECKAELLSSSDTHTDSSPEHLVCCSRNYAKEDNEQKNITDYEIEEVNRQIIYGCDQICNTCSRHQGSAVLFIQMQLCHQTLRQWLDERNHSDSSLIDVQESLSVYVQIIRGIEFIHSKGIVHHDIKPTNIFISKDGKEVQVGDFGLSCCWLHETCAETSNPTLFSSPNCPVSVTHQPGELGTKLYAAPEQLNGICDFKSDIFSLGILLFELVYPFRTNMERIEKINQLRKGLLPTDLKDSYPTIEKLIKCLVDENPENRPIASDLIKEVTDILNGLHGLEEDSNIIIQRLKEELYRKNEEIALLKRKLSALQKVTE